MFRKYAIPKNGLKVTDPNSMQHLPAEGKFVAGNPSYWVRQEKAGDVELLDEAPAPAAKSSAPTTTGKKD